MKQDNAQIVIVAIILIAIIIVAGLGYVIHSSQLVQYTISGTVKQKWIDVGSDSSYYLLRITQLDGTDKMVEVNRNIFHGSDYNPDIVYSDIEVNKTYIFTCWGWDWQWSSVYWYPNVIIAKEIKW